METTLSNGIRVIFCHLPGFAGTLYWWNEVGSVHEAPGQEGFAHFLEHMLFKDAAAKDTGKASSGQMARTIESLGGEINAYTSFEQTVYHVTCAEKHWEAVVDEFAQMARPQKFLKTDFLREREVIFEEIRRSEDSPGRQQMQKLFSLTYPSHAYGRPVIGFKKALAKAQVQHLEKFFQDHYRPDRMGLILVGPLLDEDGGKQRQDRFLEIFEKYWGKQIRSRSTPLRISKKLRSKKTHTGRGRLETMPFSVSNPSFMFSFRAPDLLHPHVPALDLLSGILGMGESSRLHQSLFKQKSLVTEIHASLYVPRDPGMLYFSADMAEPSHIVPALDAFVEELIKIKNEPPTQEEMDRVIANSESERIYATQTVDSMAGRLGFLKMTLNDPDFDQRYLEALKKTSPADVQAIAQRYLRSDLMNAVLMYPKKQDRPELIPWWKYAQQRLKTQQVSQNKSALRLKSSKKQPSSSVQLNVATDQHSSGIRMVYIHRPQSKVIGLHACYEGGLRYEGQYGGAGYVLAEAWTKGTKNFQSAALSQLIEGRAASLSGYAGRNSMGLELTCLERDWKDLYPVFAEVLINPSFPTDEVEHAQRLALDQIRSLQDHSSSLVQHLFMESLFEQHPYGRSVTGTEQSIPLLNSKVIKDLHGQWLRPERLVLTLSGPSTRQAFEDLLDECQKNFKLRDSLLEHHGSGSGPISMNQKWEAEKSLPAPRWVERKLGREQSHLVLGGLGVSVKDSERFSARVMQTLLGGQGGRLFVELREKKSLAYSVGPLSFEGIEPGYLATYIACAPEKKSEALKGIRHVLETLAHKGPSASEMSRAVEYYLGRRAMGLQSDSAIASSFGLRALYGEDPRGYQENDRILLSLTAKQIRQTCERYLLKAHQVTASVE